MAKRYIIDAIQASHWTVTLRDPESGEVFEVPLEPGAAWPGKLRSDAVPADDETPKTEVRARTPAPTEPPSAAKKARKPKGERKGVPRVTEPEALKEVMSSAALRSTPLDEDTISAEDAAAFTRLQTMLRRARGRRAGKRGDLGWDETTDAGRSGLIARFKDGAFKILHAGGDIYALFFEWDDGRYDRLGCGTAEELMNLANERAEGEPPTPPPSHLSLEFARRMCGTPAQVASATERLQPVYEEVRQKPRPTAPRAPKSESGEVPAPNDKMDMRLTESLKRALADLDAREAAEKDEE